MEKNQPHSQTVRTGILQKTKTLITKSQLLHSSEFANGIELDGKIEQAEEFFWQILESNGISRNAKLGVWIPDGRREIYAMKSDPEAMNKAIYPDEKYSVMAGLNHDELKVYDAIEGLLMIKACRNALEQSMPEAACDFALSVGVQYLKCMAVRDAEPLVKVM